MTKLKKVISGMQTGADIAALVTAKGFGLETGGTCPKGCLTTAGPQPEWAKRYNVQEHGSPKYPPRTYQNVRDGEGTLRLAYDFTTAGEQLTLKAIHQYKKPWFDVDLNNPPTPLDVANWIERYDIRTLNVAGNSERTHDGITGDCIEYLSKVFQAMGLTEQANG